MILIAHRGNINGRNPKQENRPDYLWKALDAGYRVEVDVWYDKGWWFGHDKPQYKSNLSDMSYMWCHAKNVEALQRLQTLRKFNNFVHHFWHQSDDYTLTSMGHIWVYPNKPLVKGCICVMPENGFNGNLNLCGGICSDEIEKYKYLL